jgi:hypothetical protein
VTRLTPGTAILLSVRGTPTVTRYVVAATDRNLTVSPSDLLHDPVTIERKDIVEIRMAPPPSLRPSVAKRVAQGAFGGLAAGLISALLIGEFTEAGVVIAGGVGAGIGAGIGAAVSLSHEAGLKPVVYTTR